MRKTYTEVYGSDFKGGIENEKDFIESIKNGSAEITSLLYGRVNEFSGIMQGWIPNDDDPIFHLEDNHLSENGIILADKFSKIITGNEAFYEYSFPPRGPGVIAPWVFRFITEYAIGKGVDKVIELLKSKNIQNIGKEISMDWGGNNGDSLGEVIITFTNGHELVIEGYPDNIERITVRQKKMIHQALQEKTKTKIVYDSWGRVTAYHDDSYGNSIDIRI